MSGAVITGVVAGFAGAYGMWMIKAAYGKDKLPRTVTDPAWAAATKEYLANMPRQGAEGTISMNPGRLF
ncbi:hypothetical protein ABPG77_000867 [Micractinium sp. CCAP 211/92]